MAWIDRIEDCNRHDATRFVPLWAGVRVVGHVRHDRIPTLRAAVPACSLNQDGLHLPQRAPAELSEAMEPLVALLESRGEITKLRGELYPAPPAAIGPPAFWIERALVPWLGITATGVHLNDFVRQGESLAVWVATRAHDKPTFPGQLDNLVAGGQPMGLSLADNLAKECREEADIPEALARNARPAGFISYCVEHPSGLKPDLMYVYDLELPPHFVPRNTDGEVDRFDLLPIETVAARVRDSRDFKFNSALVVLDFCIRHGVIPPDDPRYLALGRGLRRPLFPHAKGATST